MGITLATLKSHARRDHSVELNIKEKKASPSSPLLCEFCSKSYARPQTLKNHIKKHHSDQTQPSSHSFDLPNTTFSSDTDQVEIVLSDLIAIDPDLQIAIANFDQPLN